MVAREGDAIRDRCKALRGFVREAWHVLEPNTPYVAGWHIDAIAEHCEAISSGHIRRLQINEPPGCMKSLLASVLWPAWEWGPLGRPDIRFLTTSYIDTYARRDSRKMRDLVLSEWFQALWPLVLTRDGEADFENVARGARKAMPFASLTAGRGNRVIIDDPHSTETAESDAERIRAARIFRESATFRLNDPAKDAILVIMHRLHANDLCGVIEQFGMEYEKLVLPMEFEVARACVTDLGNRQWRDPRTEEGELLFPERFPREVVDRDKRDAGSYAYAGQYQQRPSPREGGMFKRSWFEVVDAAPVKAARTRAWDFGGTAESEGGNPSFTVGLKMARGPDGAFYIEDIERERLSPAGVDRMMLNVAARDTKAVRIRMPQDPGQAGKAQRQGRTAMLAGYVVMAKPVTGDKLTRAEPFAAQAEAGNVKLVRGAWNEAFLEEVGMFPNARHDDQVDAASDAFSDLVETQRSGAIIAAPMIVTAARPTP